MIAAHIKRRGGVLCLFRPALSVTAMICWAVLRYCCITALNRLLSYASTALLIRARFVRHPVAAQPLGRVMSFLSFTPGNDVIPRRFSSTKVLVFPLGPCGSGRTRELPYFSTIPPHTVRLLVWMSKALWSVFTMDLFVQYGLRRVCKTVFSCD